MDGKKNSNENNYIQIEEQFKKKIKKKELSYVMQIKTNKRHNEKDQRNLPPKQLFLLLPENTKTKKFVKQLER